MREHYQRYVEDLMSTHGLSDSALQKFQVRHRTGSFLCRYQGCQRSKQGFDSVQLRQQHEESHNPRFRCTESECGLSGWVFKTRAQLKAHSKRYHTHEDLLALTSIIQPEIEDTIRLGWNLAGLAIEDIDPSHKQIGMSDGLTWKAVHNPTVPRSLAISLESSPIFSKPGEEVTSICFNPVGTLLAVATTDRLAVLNTMNGSLKHFVQYKHKDSSLTDCVRAVCFVSYSDRLPTGGDTVGFKWSTLLELSDQFKGHKRRVQALQWYAADDIVASASNDWTVRIWTKSMRYVKHILVADGPLVSVAFAPDGQHVIAGGSECGIYVWGVENGILSAKIATAEDIKISGLWRIPQRVINKVSFSITGKEILAACSDGTVEVWNCSPKGSNFSEKSKLTFRGHKDSVTSVVPLHEELVLSGSIDGTTQLWKARTGKVITLVQCETERVTDVAASSDGGHFASGHEDGSVHIWR
ncbi:uncharacterized protein KY384_002792 [Bacidia gigantensis]|uniref:uncharacterized protein n=1 Tax=Bacidia gigantensis TaxID=2732470 RepID=UPI001D0452C9|nr:uncharacterized protein KY384_002792 [Bacidia gigantensis]KAG8532914.1 hypothetical protein KY384_002792 [Bacidia gigantensis]